MHRLAPILLVLVVVAARAAAAAANDTATPAPSGTSASNVCYQTPFNPTLACSGNGQCVNDTRTGEPSCQCSSSYAGTTCAYQRKSQLAAFLLQFFLGYFGVGYFYLGFSALGAGELVLSLGFCVIVCIAVCAGGGVMAGAAACFKGGSGGCCRIVALGFLVVGCILFVIVALGVFIGPFVWWLIVTIQIGIGSLGDSNGVGLAPW
jgi:hypothetical protein